MMQLVSAIVVLGLTYVAFSMTVGMFNTKMFRAIKGYKADVLFMVQSYVPFLNILTARKLLYGRTVFTYLMYLCGALAVFRILSLSLITVVPQLIIYSAFAMIACIVLYYALYIINAVIFSRLLQCSAGVTAVCIILPMVGYYLLAVHVLPYFKREEDKLSGTFEADEQL